MLGRFWILLGLRRYLRLTWRLMKDPRVPLLTKLPIPIAVLYVVSPFALALDMIPLLGQLDDLTVLAIAVALFIKLCPKELVREHLEAMSGRKPPTAGGHGSVIDGDYQILE